MKTLTNTRLLYDEDCPLCAAYTAGFVAAGMLDANGKISFSQIDRTAHPFVDFNRASNEIALIDTKKQTVVYGIDSLLTIIGGSFPFIKTIGNFRPVKFALKKAYSFISYNRKVIMPNPLSAQHKVQCLPLFNYRYRVAYLLLAISITALILRSYANLIPGMPEGNLMTEFILAAGQILFQAFFLINRDKKTILNYAGNLMTVSLAGALLLWPFILLSNVWEVNPLLYLAGFLLIAALMFIEHWRRVQLLGLPKLLCATWVLYRLLFLVFLYYKIS
jgi:hypothetical protein